MSEMYQMVKDFLLFFSKIRNNRKARFEACIENHQLIISNKGGCIATNIKISSKEIWSLSISKIEQIGPSKVVRIPITLIHNVQKAGYNINIEWNDKRNKRQKEDIYALTI